MSLYDTYIMKTLISASYSEAEAKNFFDYQLPRSDIDKIITFGKEILTNVPQIPYACALMSALWGAYIRDKAHIPVHVVAGNLTVNNKKIFYSDSSTENVRQDFHKSHMAWDGHVWIIVGDMIGDISIFRSAYASSKSSILYQYIMRTFGADKGMLLMRPPADMIYEAKYVLTDDEISSIVRGLPHTLETWQKNRSE